MCTYAAPPCPTLLVRTDATDPNRPHGVSIASNVIHDVGLLAKQSAAVFIGLASATTVTGNVMFNGPRAAVNVNDGLAGGHLITQNLVRRASCCCLAM
jgi:hypothetical protein